MNKQKHKNQEALELLIKAEDLGRESGDLTLNEDLQRNGR
jgi:hypothetical protein